MADLIKYVPTYLRDYVELYQLFSAENPEFTLLNENCRRVLDNTFVMYSDEGGIERFEQLLNIIPSQSATLDSRRERIMGILGNNIPYTLKGLLYKLIAIQGNDDISINVDDYIVNLTTALHTQGKIDTTVELLHDVLPCNLAVVHKNKYCHTQLHAYKHNRLSGFTHDELTNGIEIERMG